MTKNTILRFLPLILFLAMIGLFGKMLMTERNPAEIKSVLIGQPVRAFAIQGLGNDAPLSHTDLATGEVYVVNFFASWCVPCRAEHEQLMALKASGIDVIGIAYKDTPNKAQAFLDQLGNPYSRSALDLDGRVGIDWGVYGVPETFIVRGDGVIAYKHFGPLLKYNYEDFMTAYREVKRQ
jgi:cytochrome c biogenesis protein CcmG, thiol:disulfide interchange protein DsbE